MKMKQKKKNDFFMNVNLPLISRTLAAF